VNTKPEVTLALFLVAAVTALEYFIGEMVPICICLIVYVRPKAPSLETLMPAKLIVDVFPPPADPDVGMPGLIAERRHIFSR
jgi:hypothetical protein